MKAGDLKNPIQLKKPKYTMQGARRVVTWENVGTGRYARMFDVSSREFFAASAGHQEDTVTFDIRWIDGIDTTWRIEHNGTTYEILQVNHLGYKRDFLRLKTRILAGGREAEAL